MSARSKLAPLAVLCLVLCACRATTEPAEQERLFEVVRLENAEAEALAHSIGGLFAGSTVRVQGEARTNCLLLSGSPEELARAKAIVAELDVEVPGSE